MIKRLIAYLNSIIARRRVERYDTGFSCVLLMRFRYCNSLDEIDYHLNNLSMADDYKVDEWDMGARDAFNLLYDIEKNPRYGVVQ